MATRGTRYIANHLKTATQIVLTNVPRTATPADLRRLIIRGQVQGVEHAAIDYHRGEPNGRAFLELTHSDYLLPNLDALEKVSISGVHLVAEPSNRPSMAPDMVEMYADGLSTELASNGRHVVVWGLPHAVEPEVLDNEILRPSSFRFPPGEPYIFKLPRAVPFTFFSRFVVRTESISEAHRLVREIHMQPFKPLVHGHKYTLRARVIY